MNNDSPRPPVESAALALIQFLDLNGMQHLTVLIPISYAQRVHYLSDAEWANVLRWMREQINTAAQDKMREDIAETRALVERLAERLEVSPADDARARRELSTPYTYEDSDFDGETTEERMIREARDAGPDYWASYGKGGED